MEHQLTGIGRYTQELSYALRADDPGIEITLLTPYPDSPLPWYRDFPTHPLPTLGRLPAVLAFGSVQLERVARRLCLHVLHDPCGVAPFLTPHGRTRRVVTVHDAIPYTHPRLHPPLTRLVFQTFVRATQWSADAVITVSQDARTQLIQHGGLRADRLYVTPLGTAQPRDQEIAAWRDEFPRVQTDYGVRTPYILYVGAVNPRKNVARLVDAVAALRQRHPGTHLVLVGPDSPLLRELLQHPSWDPAGMRHLHYVGQRDLDVLYANASVVAVPSLVEGFGLPALEAMAHGAPVVCADRSSLPEVVGSAGVLVDPTDTTALAEALERVLTDAGLAGHLRTAGRQRAQAFTWSATAQATRRIYEEVCARAAPSRPR
jgi:glycosyltransferase involved in cell wall biosynthesis